jgi:hypothetical protein
VEEKRQTQPGKSAIFAQNFDFLVCVLATAQMAFNFSGLRAILLKAS